MLRHMFLAACGCLFTVFFLSGKASVTTDMRIMNSVQIDTLFQEGEEALERGDIDDALKIFTVVCSRDNGADSRRLFSMAHYRHGNILYSRENYAEAMQAYLQARSIAERNGIHDRLPSIYISIGNVFSAIEDLDTGISFYRKALAALGDNTESSARPVIYNNLLYAYYLKEDVDSTQKYYQLNIELAPKDPRSKYDVLLNKGLINDLQGKSKEAVRLFHLAASFARDSLDSPDCEAAANSHIAHTYERENSMDSALHYLHINEKTARTKGYNNLLAESLRDLARVYESMGNETESMRYKSDYLALSDSLFSRETLNIIKNSQALYEQNSDAYTIRNLNTANALQRYWIIVLFAVIAIIAFLSVLFWKQKRKLSDAWKELYKRNLSLLEAERHYTGRISGLENRLKEVEKDCRESATGPAIQSRKLLITKERRDELTDRISDVMKNPEFYCDPECSIDRLAAAIESNARYVSEVINDEYGMNFRAFLNKYRIKEAMRRLEDIDNYGNLTIKAIAESVGYKSQATFISVFTKETGLKPSLYQQLARNRHSE